MLAAIQITWQNLSDGVALGGLYALMAIGIGLVFGVLRLVNFAYGQLIMVGAFALAFGSQWGLPRWVSVLFCFGVVLALSALMDRLVFRPLRGKSPAVMLVATFAVAYLLQSIALLWFGPLGRSATQFATLNQPWTIGGVLIRQVTVITVVTTVVCLTLLRILLDRTSVGLHMRAASMDFATARMLGVRANRVIGGAVFVSGLFAAIVAIFLTVQDPQVTPDFALHDTIVVLAGVVLGGLNRPLTATLGGFAIGFMSGVLGGALPTNQSQYLATFVFTAVILVLLVRPNGLFTRARGTVERV
jgi:branched-chain amino acid transport system permease protein